MEPISIRGYVTDNIQRNKDNVLFGVNGFDEIHYKVLYEGFCPLQPKDAIYLAKCSKCDNGFANRCALIQNNIIINFKLYSLKF